ncbi:MAG: MFS transporter [Candidatus Competibacterales bacterium]
MATASAVDPALNGTREVRNVLLLALCQGLAISAIAITVTVSALAGLQLAPAPGFVTLPYGIMATVTACATIPMSLFMGRVGRRGGFGLGSLMGATGARVVAMAVIRDDFVLYCAGHALMGLFQATAPYFRFAATEAVRPTLRERAIAWVLGGGLLAAVLGPQLGAASFDWWAPYLFASSFVAVACLAIGVAATSALLRLPPPPKATADTAPARPLGVIARQPVYVVGVINALAAYAVMAFIMSATSPAVVGCGFGVGDAASVIQWHLVGMFAPSFVTGHLMARLGLYPVMFTGAVLLLASTLIAASGLALWQFTTALICLGVGWNFVYVGGTALVTRAHTANERAKAQGLCELLVFGSVALVTMSSGGVLASLGWAGLNQAAVPLIVLAGAATAWLAVRGEASPVPATEVR